MRCACNEDRDLAWIGDGFLSRSNVDAVAHEIAVDLLDDAPKMHADPKFDAALGRHAGVAFDEAALHLGRATHRVDHATQPDKAPVAGMRGLRGDLIDPTIAPHHGRIVKRVADSRFAGADENRNLSQGSLRFSAFRSRRALRRHAE
jgi:hypothetical protein